MALDPLAELKALHDHVVALNAELSERGFTMASDTKLRLDQAGKLITAGDKGQTDAWRVEAVDMAALLRAEAGQVGR